MEGRVLQASGFGCIGSVLVSRQAAKKERIEGAKKIELISFAPLALQFLAPLRETEGRIGPS